MEEFEHVGHWWFPQFPDNKVAGILKFHPIEGARLKIIGHGFLEPIKALYGVPERPTKGATLLPSFAKIDIILGRTTGGKDVTLQNCQEAAMLGSSWHVDNVFFGCHFEDARRYYF